MDRIAFIIGTDFIYWSSVIVSLGALTAVFAFLGFYLGRSKNALAAFLLLPLAAVGSLYLSRLLHWYCRTDAYESLNAAMTQLPNGGFALLGAFAACLLAAGILRLLGICKDLPKMLDAMALAGCAGIAVGRLAPLFSTADRGMIIPGMTSLPWVFPVNNAVTGEPEYRLATFMLQAMVAAALFVGLLLFERCSRKRKDGDTCLIFLLIYSCSQVVLDSTRYDSLFFRTNGFVSIVQIVCALTMAAVIVVFSVRLVKNRGFQGWYVGLWLGELAMMGLAGYMEYHVQRHGDQAAFAYTLMSLALLTLIAMTLALRLMAGRKNRTIARRRADGRSARRS